MTRRWGPGPVFSLEWLTTSRRPRPGLYAAVGLSWGVPLLPRVADFPMGHGLSEVNPFHGAYFLTVGIAHPDDYIQLFALGVARTAVYAAIAVVLLLSTLATFDRCLGRAEMRCRLNGCTKWGRS
jgi:hypothetical protein